MQVAKILIVDDEQIALKAFNLELKEKGFDVEIADTPAGAIEMVQQKRFDIVYVDLVMPEMNGVMVCRKIKEISCDTEVVLISGHPRQIEDHLYDFISAGGRDEQLRKPLMKDELTTTTERIWIEISAKRSDD